MFIGAAGALLVIAAVLTFVGLRDQIVYFVAPSELAEKAQAGQRIRLGGLVSEGSLQRDGDGAVRFDVTDGVQTVSVRYEGLLPDLFREGQGVVAEGVWNPGRAFEAQRVLAKHDETYMPREVAEALKQRGEWKGAEAP
ncbi:cytochrome c-type biogenesis protein CcmE [alpha proteobacterium U9-1i]|nr:cytochrome c-type biogenesis protein CcmE [alpha proteobacterium U9-1i]